MIGGIDGWGRKVDKTLERYNWMAKKSELTDKIKGKDVDSEVKSETSNDSKPIGESVDDKKISG